MFKINDFVINANNGICQIKDEVELALTGEAKLYYLVVPVKDVNGKIYIPVDNASDRIRRVMTKKKANSVIDSITDIEELVIDNEKQRENIYKSVISACDPESLIAIIKHLVKRSREREAEGKKRTVLDERYCKLAQDSVYAELAFATGKDILSLADDLNQRIESSC